MVLPPGVPHPPQPAGARGQRQQLRIDQPDEEGDPPMAFNARSDQQESAVYGIIAKPSTEDTVSAQSPEELKDVVHRAEKLIEKYSSPRSRDILAEIERDIHHYLDNRTFTYIPHPEEGMPAGPAPAAGQPREDAPIEDTHRYEIRRFVFAVEDYYRQHFHQAECIGRAEDILMKFCRRIKTVIGCLLSTINFESERDLVRFLKNLSQVAREIKAKCFNNEIFMDKIHLFLKTYEGEESLMQLVEGLLKIAMKQIHVLISVPHTDLLGFLKDSSHALVFTIQALVLPDNGLFFKPDPEKLRKFTRKFDDYTEFQINLKDIFSEQREKEEDPAALKLALKEKVGDDDDGEELSSVSGAVPKKPALLKPPPVSPDTKIPSFSENEIDIRLEPGSKAKEVLQLCHQYGLIDDIIRNKDEGWFTVRFAAKSSADNALRSITSEHVYQVRQSKLRYQLDLRDTVLYIGELDPGWAVEDLVKCGSRFEGFDISLAKPPSQQGFAFLSFETPDNATAALSQLQSEGELLVIRARPSHQKPKIFSLSVDEIDIRLPTGSKVKDVLKLCHNYGLVDDIAERRDGWYTVRFAEKSSAEKALMSITSEPGVEVQQSELGRQFDLKDNVLYVRELDPQVNLVKYGSRFAGFNVSLSRPSSRGFGFLNFDTASDATAALHQLQSEGELVVTRARARARVSQKGVGSVFPEPPPGQLPKLFISKLPGREMMEEECTSYLRGLVASVLPPDTRIVELFVTRIQIDPDKGLTFRHGFVTLETLGDCMTVMMGLSHNTSIAQGFESEPLQVKWAKPRRR